MESRLSKPWRKRPRLQSRESSRLWGSITPGPKVGSTACQYRCMVYLLERVNLEPVFDQTGLTGKYYFSFRCAYTPRPDVVPESPQPTLERALQQYFGLDFKKTKGTIEKLIIDHVEAPGEN
jgi:uncharacterized protein (TIGR03435 family)